MGATFRVNKLDRDVIVDAIALGGSSESRKGSWSQLCLITNQERKLLKRQKAREDDWKSFEGYTPSHGQLMDAKYDVDGKMALILDPAPVLGAQSYLPV